MRRMRSERGAVAVEFALVLPLLVAMLLGIMEFGLMYNGQVSVTNAARETARTMVVTNDPAAARNAARAATPGLNPGLTNAEIRITPATCTPGATARITISHPFGSITKFFGPGVTLTGRAAMRCGG
ncbi:TadE/TadG family type IV pilus assembly protein [Microbacteriaceae bacterium 4G12]